MADDSKQPTRQRILDVAFALFVEHGYHRTSVRAIAEQLGISKAAVLYHFPAKGDIIGALAEPFLDDYEAALLSAAGLGPERARWAAIEGVLDVLLTHRHLLRLSLHDLALVAPGRVYERFTAAMGLANRLVAGENPSFAQRVRASQAVSILGDPVVLFADEPTDELRAEVLKGLRLLVGPSGLVATDAGPAPSAAQRGRGRPTTLSDADIDRARQWHAAGRYSASEIARRLGVSRATVYRSLDKNKL
ncbi:MAG TPA: TetR family transcriptional regulator [Stackebrandtia sp.]|uniref:TetR family transcriptional regulator n=1 Tax=Stackebrandtia sp. TaxID=2023065 RepID=UPI002D5E1F64|nr:TetR family transcriptional regulator [Stackebrandtia sp.]HZE39802.1 TetR family transcriptional regulator [Stackebrandtia sp.]